jgi:predicted NBD/HSP70 family sugar kinase
MTSIKTYLGSSPSTIKEINMSIVLDRIRDQKFFSRVDLARNLNLTQTSISRIVNELLDKGLIEEHGFGVSKVGKKPTLLKYNSKRAYVIGAGTDIDYINIMLTDLDSNCINYTSKTLPLDLDKKMMTKMVVAEILSNISKSGIEKEKIEAIVIGIPCIVDPVSRMISYSSPYINSWNGVNLEEEISNATGIPTIAENEAKLAVLGEHKYGVGKGIDNMIFISIGSGIGSGILLNGKLYKGFKGAAGEIGYLIISSESLIPKDKFRGQFEYLSSSLALIRTADKLARSRQQDYLVKSYSDTSGEISINRILEARKSGEKNAKIIVKEIIDNLSYGIINAIVMLNPQLVVIRGAIFEKDPLLFEELKKKIRNVVPVVPDIMLSKIGSQAIIMGAINMAIQEVENKVISPLFY